jgi:hypothetical protein
MCVPKQELGNEGPESVYFWQGGMPTALRGNASDSVMQAISCHPPPPYWFGVRP